MKKYKVWHRPDIKSDEKILVAECVGFAMACNVVDEYISKHGTKIHIWIEGV